MRSLLLIRYFALPDDIIIVILVGQQKELQLSANLLSLLFIQLGTESVRLYPELKPTLLARLRDTSLNPSCRASVSTLLSI